MVTWSLRRLVDICFYTYIRGRGRDPERIISVPGCVGAWTWGGPMGAIPGSPFPRYPPSAGQQDSSTAAQQHSSTAAQQHSSAAAQQDSRTAGQQNSRTAGQQDSRTTGQPTRPVQPKSRNFGHKKWAGGRNGAGNVQKWPPKRKPGKTILHNISKNISLKP